MQTVHTPLASRWSRFVSSFVDGILIMALTFPFAYFFVMGGNIQNAKNLSTMQGVMLSVFGWVVFWPSTVICLPSVARPSANQ